MSTTVIEPETAVDQPPVIEFAETPPGLPGLAFSYLLPLDEHGSLYELRPVQDDGVRLLLIPPGDFFPDYAPEIDDDTAASLGLTDAADALLLVVVNPGSGAGDATANLMAPVIINIKTHRAAQVLLVDSDLPLRAPLTSA